MSQIALRTARQVLEIEAQAIRKMMRELNKNFIKAIDLMYQCEGRVIVTGMGKPGFIARKIAATLASTGTPSLFLHPAEASHGDLGMVTAQDVMIAISQSGETAEILKLVEGIKKIRVALIVLTSNLKSSLAKQADVVLNLGVDREACPLNLAPSASTTASLAMGDALALSLLKKKGFSEEDFAELHPGGSLGRKLLKVKDLMRTGPAHPTVQEKTPIRQALFSITTARAGSCSVVDARGKLIGIFTDGDLRRQLRLNGEKILSEPVGQFATRRPLAIEEERLATEALNIIRSRKIDELPVIDKKGKAVGLLDVQDLLKAGFV